MSAMIYQNADVVHMISDLHLSRCEAQVYAGHFADYVNGRNNYQQTAANIRHARGLVETRISHLPGCKCPNRGPQDARCRVCNGVLREDGACWTCASPRKQSKRARALALLNLTEGALPEQIRASYLNLARKYHPDLNSGDGEKMKQLNEAYSLLTKEKS